LVNKPFLPPYFLLPQRTPDFSKLATRMRLRHRVAFPRSTLRKIDGAGWSENVVAWLTDERMAIVVCLSGLMPNRVFTSAFSFPRHIFDDARGGSLDRVNH
jgi:hypothetical protein